MGRDQKSENIYTFYICVSLGALYGESTDVWWHYVSKFISSVNVVILTRTRGFT